MYSPYTYIVSTIFAPEDEDLHDELMSHLMPLQSAGYLKAFSSNGIFLGAPYKDAYFKIIKRSDIVLILMSASFYKPTNHPLLESLVIDTRQIERQIMLNIILIRPIEFVEDPIFKEIPVLPQNREPIVHRSWDDRNYAWMDVVSSIKKNIDKIEQERLARLKISNQTYQMPKTSHLIMSSYTRKNYLNLWINRIKKIFYQ